MTDAIGGNAAKQLKSFVDRVERQVEERKAINKDIVDILNEAAAVGFDKKIIRKVIQRRALAAADREAMDATIETYEGAIGSE
jgi:uncharacterized protein (UPF0335 family)